MESFERLLDWVERRMEVRDRARRLYAIRPFEALHRHHKQTSAKRLRIARERGYDTWAACRSAQEHAEWMRHNGAGYARGPLDPPEPAPPSPAFLAQISEPVVSGEELWAAWSRGEQGVSVTRRRMTDEEMRGQANVTLEQANGSDPYLQMNRRHL